MRIYLAGPMRGIPNFNREAFRQAARNLRSLGHEVFCPAESTEAIYGEHVYQNQPEGDEPKAGVDGRVVFKEDLVFICEKAEAIALMPGWENSKGATAEHAVARALGLKFIYLV